MTNVLIPKDLFEAQHLHIAILRKVLHIDFTLGAEHGDGVVMVLDVLFLEGLDVLEG
jgi:hypothetical protein